MKILLILVLILYHTNTIFASNGNEDEGPAQINTVINLKEVIGRGLYSVWSWIQSLGKTRDTFVGRCIGAVKRINQLLPIIVFKMGVIMTTLGFLTIFSLKSLALLVLIVIMNSTGFITKLALFKNQEKEHSQNIHLHVHQSKNGHYHVDSSGPGYGYEGWSDKSSVLSDTMDNGLMQRLKRFNIYDD